MAKVTCAVCKEEGDSQKMYYCDKDNLWVHLECAGGDLGYAGFFAHKPHCPNCGKKLEK